jgi:hypothetical protein
MEVVLSFVDKKSIIKTKKPNTLKVLGLIISLFLLAYWRWREAISEVLTEVFF